MNGTIDEFKKGFDRLFWRKQIFADLSSLQAKSVRFYESQNKYDSWKLRDKDLKSITPIKISDTISI
jgi:hypothetical protein